MCVQREGFNVTFGGYLIFPRLRECRPIGKEIQDQACQKLHV